MEFHLNDFYLNDPNTVLKLRLYIKKICLHIKNFSLFNYFLESFWDCHCKDGCQKLPEQKKLVQMNLQTALEFITYRCPMF